MTLLKVVVSLPDGDGRSGGVVCHHLGRPADYYGTRIGDGFRKSSTDLRN